MILLYDGDTVYSTNNKVLLRNTRDLPAIQCVQQTSEKQEVTEKLLREANKNGFGNDVGTITNRATSMFDVLANFRKGSFEYDELMYRITVSQHYQQVAIDKIKGIVAEPMPKSWFTAKECISQFEKDVVCDKKPYFMTYIYSNEKNKYKKFLEASNMRMLIKYGLDIEEIMSRMYSNDTRATLKLQLGESKFNELMQDMEYYERLTPVSNGKCVMNRICRYMEYKLKEVNREGIQETKDFNHEILKHGEEYITDVEVVKYFKECFEEYRYLQGRGLSKSGNGSTQDNKLRSVNSKNALLDKYAERITKVVEIENISIEALTNTMVDIVYGTKDAGSRMFLWYLCDEQLINNLKLNKEEED